MILTLLALFGVLIGVVCILIENRKENYSNEGWLFAGVCVLVIAGVCLLICIGSISFKEVSAQVHIAKIEAVRETFASARVNENINPLELAAIQQKAADKNEWIAEARYWTKHPLTNWFWSKKILAIEPIR